MPNSHASETETEQAAGSEERDLAAELEQMEDRLKRAVADLDNYRKRSARDLGRLLAERSDTVLRDWLEVVDGVERALRQTAETPLYDGLRAVLEHMDAVLERQGVRRLGERGESFDPNRHEAVEVVRGSGGQPGTILEEMRRGYMFRDRLLRPALVRVAGGSEDGDGRSEAGG